MKNYETLFVLLLLGTSLSVFAQEGEIDFTIYHSSQDLNSALEDLIGNCDNRLQIDRIGSNPELSLISINSGQEAPNKAFLLFGEHPRELISSETGLRLVKDICSNNSPLAEKVNKDYELQIILNANPISRQKVEAGNYCLRENEKGVDINRNYDAHWEHVQDDLKQVSSGDHPFSESETQTISEQVKAFEPHMFLSIHSGTLGMYTPYAYSQDLAQENQDNMLDILESVNEKHCKMCSVGAAGKEVGYLCPGTCLDWAYDAVGIKYSFAIEIYENGVDLREELGYQSEKALLQVQESNAQNAKFLGKSENQQDQEENKSCFLQNNARTTTKSTDAISEYEKCFLYFNPEERDHYNFLVENWSTAILKMMDMTSEKRAK